MSPGKLEYCTSFTIGGIFSPMEFQDCPEILSLSGSVKEGQDEFYHRLDFCSLIMLDGFCRFESEAYERDIIPGDILIVPAGRSRIYRHPLFPEMPPRSLLILSDRRKG